MRFKTRGHFATEDILEVAQRVVAQVQDAGVDHVSGFNIYLTPTDSDGRHRRFVKDGLEVDHVEVEVWDLTLPEPESEMSSVYANEPTNAPRTGYRRKGPSSTKGHGRKQSQ